MLEHRRNEAIQEDDEAPSSSCLSVDPTAGSSFVSAVDDITEDACTRAVQFSDELPSTSSESASAPTSLALSVVPVLKLGHIWKALIGEFSVRPAWLPSGYEQRSFMVYRMGEQLYLRYSSCDESSELQWSPEEDSCAVECSLSRIPFEDLDWLQKRRVVQLCHQTKEQDVKVQLFAKEFIPHVLSCSDRNDKNQNALDQSGKIPIKSIFNQKITKIFSDGYVYIWNIIYYFHIPR